MGATLIWDFKGESTNANTLTFDIITAETQTKSSTITEHPVEKGADITDHIRIALDRITLEGFVSNAPLVGGRMASEVLDIPEVPQPLGLNSLVNAVGNAIGSLLGGPKQIVAHIMEFGENVDFVARTISTLTHLRDTATLVTVVCPNQVYENMLIEEFEVQRDADAGTGANFTVQLREIRTVQSSIVAAPKPTIPRAKPKQDKGGQTPQEEPEAKKSVLKKLLGL